MNRDRAQLAALRGVVRTTGNTSVDIGIDSLQKTACVVSGNHGANISSRIDKIKESLDSALREYLSGNKMSEEIAPFSRAENELTDALIGLLSVAEKYGFELEKVYKIKARKTAT
jgi:predicted house-cleaning noncanonical NTP pyrophosphatase (MazG superfamily)